MLENLDYDAVNPITPNDKRIRFQYIVHSTKFNRKRDIWEGDVVDVMHNNKTIPFSDKQELEAIVQA